MRCGPSKGCIVHQLSIPQQVQVIALLCEGTSIRSISRLMDIHRDTVMRLGARIGAACDQLHDRTMRDLQIPVLQIDETWSFIQKKQHNRQPDSPPEQGDCYLWLAFDPLTKVVVSYHLGKRTGENARALLTDLHGRLLNRPQLSTDGFNAYVDAVDDVFGTEVDYASIVKDDGFRKQVHQGNPDLEQVSTSLLERCNLTVRMQLKRHARRTNAHSKTLEHHRAAVALHFAFYHFCRVHETLRVTPAMELGVTNHIWSVGELMELAQSGQVPAKPAPLRRGFLRVIQGGKR